MVRFRITLLLWVSLFISCQSNTESIKVEKRDWVESIYASSKVQSVNQYAHYAEVSGRLIRYHVREGDTVNAGDLIAELDGVNLETRLKIAQYQRDQVSSNQSRIQELRLQIETAQNQLNRDSSDFASQQRLFKSGIGSQSQRDLRELKYQQSKSQFLSLNLRLRSLQEEIYAQLKQSQQNVALAQNQRDAYRIYAIRRGRIYELRTKTGEMVSLQQPIALIGDVQQFLVEMEIDERDISKIKEGQEVIVKLDAYKETFKARISSISPYLDAQTQTFHAEARFEGLHPTFYPGLTAESNIILQKKNQVWVVPLKALIENQYIETSQGKKKVTTGLRNAQFVEITSGIDTEIEIILPQ